MIDWQKLQNKKSEVARYRKDRRKEDPNFVIQQSSRRKMKKLIPVLFALAIGFIGIELYQGKAEFKFEYTSTSSLLDEAPISSSLTYK